MGRKTISHNFGLIGNIFASYCPPILGLLRTGEKQINKKGSTELTIHGGGKELIGETVGMEHKEETGEEEQISKVGGKEQEKKPRGKEQRDKERATGEDKAVG